MVVIVDYETVADVKKSISWVESSIAKFGGDGERVTVMVGYRFNTPQPPVLFSFHPHCMYPPPLTDNDDDHDPSQGYASGSHIAALALMDGLVPTATATASSSSSSSSSSAATGLDATASKAVALDGAVAAECKAMSWATTYRLAALMLDVIFFGTHKTNLVDEILAELETASLLITPATPGLPNKPVIPFKKRSPWFLSMEDAASSTMASSGGGGTATTTAAVTRSIHSDSDGDGDGIAAVHTAVVSAGAEEQNSFDPAAVGKGKGKANEKLKAKKVAGASTSRARENRSGFLFHASPHRPTQDDDPTFAAAIVSSNLASTAGNGDDAASAEVGMRQPDLQPGIDRGLNWSATRPGHRTSAAERVAQFAAATKSTNAITGSVGTASAELSSARLSAITGVSSGLNNENAEPPSAITGVSSGLNNENAEPPSAITGVSSGLNNENAEPPGGSANSLAPSASFETPPKPTKKATKKAAPAPFLSPRHWGAAY